MGWRGLAAGGPGRNAAPLDPRAARPYRRAMTRPAPRHVLLVLCLLAGGAISAALGTDRNWDLRNYHLYGAHAWWHGRVFTDVAAAQMQSYFNPAILLPQYALLWALNGWPRLYAFAMGLPAGWFLFLALRIGAAHAAALRPGAPLPAAAAGALVALLAFTGAATWPIIGSTSADITVAALVAAAYLLVLRQVVARDGGAAPRLSALAAAGALAGLAAGLKLTSVPFVAALGLMVLALLGFRAAVAMALPMLAALAAAWGPHLLFLWRETGNPLFPLYNDVFRSPLFPPERTGDERFLPRSALQAVFYPFWWLRETSGLVTELRMRDGRVALGYVAALAVAALLLAGRGRGAWRGAALPLGVAALGYAAWAKLFGIYRYLTMLELLSALLVLLAALLAWRGRPWAGPAALALAALVLLPTTTRPNWGHGRHGAAVVEVPPLPVPADGLLVGTDGEPIGYLVPFLPPGVPVLGLQNNIMRVGVESGLSRQARARIAAHGGPIWSVGAPGGPVAMRDAALGAYGLRVAGPCQRVATSLERGGHEFCPLERAN